MKEHLVKFDILRAVAILLVFFYHASLVIFGPLNQYYSYSGFWLNLDNFPNIDKFLLLTPAVYGGSGVTLFLIISGFLIHYGTIRRNKAFDVKQFYNKRFWRIYPPYLLALIFFFVFKTGHNKTDFFTHFFLVHNLDESSVFTINPSFWSLALEAQLYLVYPIYLFLYRKLGNRNSFLIIITFSGVVLAFQYLFHFRSDVLNTSILKYWVIWVSGAWLAGKFASGKRISKIKGYQLIIFFSLIVLLQLTRLYEYSFFYFITIFYILSIDWFLYQQVDFNNRVWHFILNIGLCSYSLYLFHQPFLWEMINIVRFGYYSFLIMAPIVFFVLYLISWVSYKYVELPSIAAGRKFYSFLEKRKFSTSSEGDVH